MRILLVLLMALLLGCSAEGTVTKAPVCDCSALEQRIKSQNTEIERLKMRLTTIEYRLDTLWDDYKWEIH